VRCRLRVGSFGLVILELLYSKGVGSVPGLVWLGLVWFG
jgi:hypothetical protein